MGFHGGNKLRSMTSLNALHERSTIEIANSPQAKVIKMTPDVE